MIFFFTIQTSVDRPYIIIIILTEINAPGRLLATSRQLFNDMIINARVQKSVAPQNRNLHAWSFGYFSPLFFC